MRPGLGDGRSRVVFGVCVSSRFILSVFKMPILPSIEEQERQLKFADALSRLVSDAQRDRARLLSQVDVPAIMRMRDEAEAALAQVIRHVDLPAIQRAQRDMVVAVAEPLKDVSESFRALEKHVAANAEPFRRLQQQVAAISEPIQRLAEVAKRIELSWLESAKAVAAHVQLAEQNLDRRVARALMARGWLGIERHVTPWELGAILEGRKPRRGVAIDRAICVAFRRNRNRHIKSMTKLWMTVPYLQARRTIIRQAVRAHLDSKYALSIAALLPLVDGLADDLRRKNPHIVRPGKQGKAKLGEAVGDVVALYDPRGRARDYGDAVITAVSQRVFKDYHFTTDPVPSSLNRHGILHGRIAEYPSEVNSLRALLLVDVMAQVATGLP
jgi:hypothetical protein